ncbi:MAG: histidine phosphatase family protein [Burkholderiales bacterium]
MTHTISRKTTEVILVRHGETGWNAEGRIQGHLDISLNNTGLAQAEAVGCRFSKDTFDAIFSSDLDRAYRTAVPVAPQQPHAISRTPRLRERHLGVLQGLTTAEAERDQPHACRIWREREVDTALPGGESLAQFHSRVIDFVTDVCRERPDGRLLLVTHGGVLDAVYRHAVGMPLGAAREFPILNASVNVIRVAPGGWSIESWGDVSHLPDALTLDDT